MALDILEQHPEISLVISGYVLPEMEGCELCKKMTGGKAGGGRKGGKVRHGLESNSVSLSDLDITKAQSSR